MHMARHSRDGRATRVWRLAPPSLERSDRKMTTHACHNQGYRNHTAATVHLSWGGLPVQSGLGVVRVRAVIWHPCHGSGSYWVSIYSWFVVGRAFIGGWEWGYIDHWVPGCHICESLKVFTFEKNERSARTERGLQLSMCQSTADTKKNRSTQVAKAWRVPTFNI